MLIVYFVISVALELLTSIVGCPLPKNICSSPIALVNTSKSRAVVGNGTPGSCDENALRSALVGGGIITFNCSSTGQPVNIGITKELAIVSKNETIIDGAGRVTLNGLGLTRIFKFDAGDYRYATPQLTIQRLRLINGRCQDSDGGCAILQKSGGTTVVIDSIFEDNVGPVVGQDVAGGAIWTIGGGTTTVVRSVFKRNKCSNGGAIGILGSGLTLMNSHLEENEVTGNGGNPGNGGNGGAISFDGRGRSNQICGTRLTRNRANKFGGAFFRVSYNGNETNDFHYDLIDQNSVSINGSGLAGGLYLQGGTASILQTSIAKNSATGAGGIFFSQMNSIQLNRVHLIGNEAYSALGGAMFCSNPVGGHFTSLIIANNTAGAFGAAIASCTTTIRLSNSLIGQNRVGNPWPANACTTTLADGGGNVQSPVNKQSPATGVDPSCTNGTIQRTDQLQISLDETTWKVTVSGGQTTYLGPNEIPGL